MRTLLIAIVVLLVFGGGYYWYTSMNAAPEGPQDASMQDTNIPQDTGAQNTGTQPSGAMEDGTIDANVDVSVGAMVGAIKEFTVSNAGLTFNPKTLAVKKGDRVKITFKNTGGTHDLRVDGYGVGTKVISANQQESFEFTADKAGSFEYFCSVGNHRAMGMKGTLTVTP